MATAEELALTAGGELDGNKDFSTGLLELGLFALVVLEVL